MILQPLKFLVEGRTHTHTNAVNYVLYVIVLWSELKKSIESGAYQGKAKIKKELLRIVY